MATRRLSVRLSDGALHELEQAATRSGKTKRAFLEAAILEAARKDDLADLRRALDESFGTMVRPDETPEETIANMRREAEDAWRRNEARWDAMRNDGSARA